MAALSLHPPYERYGVILQVEGEVGPEEAMSPDEYGVLELIPTPGYVHPRL